MPLPFIADGYTITSLMPANLPLYDSFTYTFRHASQNECAALVRKITGLDLNEQIEHRRQFAVDHLESWSLKPEPEHQIEAIAKLPAEKGFLVISKQSLSILYAAVMDEMIEVIGGNLPPIDPTTKKRCYPLTKTALEKN